MSTANIDLDQVDLSQIEDPNARRALRAMQQHIADTLHRQQLEIDAILEMIQEKNVGSLADFRRHLMKLKTNSARTERIHTVISTIMDESGAQSARQ